MQSETNFLADHGYALLKHDLGDVKLRCSQLEARHEEVQESLEQKCSEFQSKHDSMREEIAQLRSILQSVRPVPDRGKCKLL